MGRVHRQGRGEAGRQTLGRGVASGLWLGCLVLQGTLGTGLASVWQSNPGREAFGERQTDSRS